MGEPTASFRQVVLKRRPAARPVAGDFELLVSEPPALGPDDVHVAFAYLGMEPAARPRMDAATAYSTPTPLGHPPFATGVGRVIRSRSGRFAPGDWVFALAGWQTAAVLDSSALRAIDVDRAPPVRWLSLLGLSSFTAWVGITELARPRPGETVVVSAAAGATGAIAGQVAKILGARVIGVAGGEHKCRYVESLGFDACVDHRGDRFVEALRAACPAGIDVDFENVGGEVLDAVFAAMNRHGRVILCGLAAEYNLASAPPGPNLWRAVHRALRMEGFLASHYFDRIPRFVDQALAWAAEGRLQQREHVVAGIENAPAAFDGLLAGRHLGKMVLDVRGG